MKRLYEVEVYFHKDFIKVDGDKIQVWLTSKPKDGKANFELIKKIARHFNLSSSNVRILSGLKSRRKVVEVLDEEFCS
ncbi:MAG: DUF167 domain-containing protein [Nitrososphaeria archaeon]